MQSATKEWLMILGCLFFLIILGRTLYSISKYLTRKLSVSFIDYGIALLVSIGIFQRYFKQFFAFIGYTADHLIYVLSNKAKSTDFRVNHNLLSDFFVKGGLLNLILLLTFFFVLSYLISLARIKYNLKTDNNLDDNAKERKDILLKNATTSIIIMISIYLCIATLMAVPLFNLNKKDDLDLLNQAKTQINIYDEEDKVLESRYIKMIKELGARFIQNKNDNTHEAEYDSLNKIDSPKYKGIKPFFWAAEDNFKAKFTDLKFTKQSVIKRLELYNLKEINSISKAKYYTKEIDKYFKIRKNQLVSLNKEYVEFVNKHAKELNASSSEKEMRLFELKPLVLDLESNLEVVSEYNSEEVHSGVIGFFTGWLLKDPTYDLIIIIGLIGFGFLGATVSTFIREKNTQNNKDLLLGDILGVIIRGFTAALIIFLAVQGGLSILTQESSNDLNAYALFFTCFGSAVFSENAWEWVKRKLDMGDKTEPESVTVHSRKEKLNEDAVLKKLDSKIDKQTMGHFQNKESVLLNKLNYKLKEPISKVFEEKEKLLLNYLDSKIKIDDNN